MSKSGKNGCKIYGFLQEPLFLKWVRTTGGSLNTAAGVRYWGDNISHININGESNPYHQTSCCELRGEKATLGYNKSPSMTESSQGYLLKSTKGSLFLCCSSSPLHLLTIVIFARRLLLDFVLQWSRRNAMFSLRIWVCELRLDRNSLGKLRWKWGAGTAGYVWGEIDERKIKRFWENLPASLQGSSNAIRN